MPVYVCICIKVYMYTYIYIYDYTEILILILILIYIYIYIPGYQGKGPRGVATLSSMGVPGGGGGSRQPQDGPRWPKVASKTVQEAFETAQERSKTQKLA